MLSIRFDGEGYALAAGESVLECLERHGRSIPSSCRAGVCQSCLMQATDGIPPETAQIGLKPALKEQGYFLACRWRPSETVAVKLPRVDDVTVSARIDAIAELSRTVKSFRLTTDAAFPCIPGQYLSLIGPEHLVRSYSIANQPDLDGHIELHVRLVPGGRMSTWLHEQAAVGDGVRIRGPIGACCYARRTNKARPLVLAGTGTGLAPLHGIVLDALTHGHTGRIVIVHGGLRPADLYFTDRLTALAAKHRELTYRPCVLGEAHESGFEVGHIEDVLLEEIASAPGADVFLCGAPEFVNAAKRKAFLAGVSLARLHSDAFVMAASSPAQASEPRQRAS